jgi:PPM family protein phosphatase
VSYNFFGSTDGGKTRELNEDAFNGFVHNNTLFLIIADGLGGKEGAVLASHITVNEFRRYVERYMKNNTPEHLGELLEQALYFANRVTLGFKRAHDSLYGGFGSSVTACAINEHKDMMLAHAGNTRLYFIRGGQIIPVTKDHTEAQALVDAGKLTREEMRLHPERLSLTKGIGMHESPQFDVYGGKIQAQDIVYLCTDGIYGLMDENEMRDVILESGESKKACEWLVEAGNRRGGTDNMAALLSFINF